MDIHFIGNYRGQNQGFCGSVYGWGGCAPTIRARDDKEPVLILVEVTDEQQRTYANMRDCFKPTKGIRRYYRCAIVEKSFKKNGLCGTYTSKSYYLRYCPECGKELRNGKKEEVLTNNDREICGLRINRADY